MRKLPLVIVSSLCLAGLSIGTVLADQMHDIVQVSNQQDTIVWNKTRFQVNSKGQLYAPFYSRQTIRDLASYLKYNGYTRYSFIPSGRQGAIPYALKDFAYCTMLEYGIKVTNYTATTGTVRWGVSQFEVLRGVLFADHYNEQTIVDLVDLNIALGNREVQLMPDGKRGAIPNHLKPLASHLFQQAGIKVHNQGYVKPYKEKKAQSQGSPEDLLRGALVEVFKNSK